MSAYSLYCARFLVNVALGYEFHNVIKLTVISGFRRYVDQICGVLGYYAASSGNCLPTFRDKVSDS
jgi:hypothetical protein